MEMRDFIPVTNLRNFKQVFNELGETGKTDGITFSD